MKSAGKARSNGLYRHIRTSKEIIRNLLNDLLKYFIQLFGVTSKSYINFNNFGRKVTKSGKAMISTTTAT